jgi:isopentenyl-diphosphate delta-isomerase
MTAGHQAGEDLNYTLAKACSAKNWLFAVGSQRKQLSDPTKDQEWTRILQEFPDLNLVGNLGLAQLISSGPEVTLKLLESLKAKAVFIHCNPLQEVLQLEGTPQFKGGLKAIAELSALCSVPVIIKETGCGFDAQTLKQLFAIPKLYGVDVAGFGGTHWGRIEGHRNEDSAEISARKEMFIEASQTYANWGLSTAQSLSYASEITKASSSKSKYWASGGVRNGLDIVSCLAMGAEMVGLAQPILKHALEGYDSLIQYMELLEFETKIGLFCSGYLDVSSCQKDAKWEWKS